MSEMVERVARAISEFWPPKPHQYPVELTAKQLARAAIAAMREPTEAMLVEGPGMICAGGAREEIWQEMIDAALSEDVK